MVSKLAAASAKREPIPIRIRINLLLKKVEGIQT
jgi:hypothetical protein